MPLLRFFRAPIVLSPSFIAPVAWFMVAFLYSLHLSSLLLFTTQEVVGLTLLIVVPILVVSLFFRVAYSVGAQRKAGTVVVEDVPFAQLEGRVRQCLYLWFALAVIETLVSGGVPLVWVLTGNGKSTFDYGIPSVHGMVNALLLALAVTSFALYLYTGKRRHLPVIIFAIFWSFVVVSRGSLFVLMAECAVIYLRIRRVRWTNFVRLAGLAVVFLLIFGYVGDLRSGADAFRNLSQPTSEFPDWAPSGLLWAYIYITTPINNLLYTMHTTLPSYNPLLPNTAATLFPTVLRNIIYGKQGSTDAISGSLVVEALNVSTAYTSPFQDMGRLGIVGFSTLSAALCEFYWRRNGFRNMLYFAVFAQALMLSLFYNMLFYLPILGQLVWFYYFTYRGKQKEVKF
jgi:oligosaccharide repeat unit polymerase